MNWKCPNCGKRVVFSDEQLAETRGVVVCPQCLSSDQLPGYDAPRARHKSSSSAASVSPSVPSSSPSQTTQQPRKVTTPPPHRQRQSPPPHRPKITFADTAADPPKRTRKGGTAKKKAKNASSGFMAPKSPLGCLWRSVIYTLVLLIIYVVFGLLMQGL